MKKAANEYRETINEKIHVMRLIDLKLNSTHSSLASHPHGTQIEKIGRHMIRYKGLVKKND